MTLKDNEVARAALSLARDMWQTAKKDPDVYWALWSHEAALRGPDLANRTMRGKEKCVKLKNKFTVPIRHEIAMRDTLRAYSISDLKVLLEEAREIYNRESSNCGSARTYSGLGHWIGHVADALEIIILAREADNADRGQTKGRAPEEAEEGHKDRA